MLLTALCTAHKKSKCNPVSPDSANLHNIGILVIAFHISHPPPNSSPTNDPRIRGDFEHPHIGFPSASPRQLARFAHPRREQRKIPSVKRKISAGTFKNKTPSTASRSRGRFCRLDASPLAVAPQTGSRMDAREISTRCACLFTPIFPSNIPSNDRP